MKLPFRGWLAIVATLSVAACSPSPTPEDAADVTSEATADRPAPVDVRTDSQTPDVTVRDVPEPDVMMPDVTTPDVPDVTTTDVTMPDVTMPDVPDVVMPDGGMDAMSDAGPDAGADVADARPDAADSAVVMPGCGLTVDAPLAVPPMGMTTTINTTLNAMGTGGMINSSGCVSTTGGAERIYRLTITARTGVIIRATAMNSATDLTLALRRTCDSAVGELACNDDSDGLNPALRAELDPGEYFVVLDEFGSAADATGGPVTLTLQTFTPAVNSDCATAETLTGMTRMGNTNNGGIPAMTCSPFNRGPQLFYSLTIPANSLATITATPSGMPAWTPFVRVFADCASAATCLTTALGPSAGSPSTALFENRMAMARTVLVSVGSTSASNGGEFTLTGTTTPLPPAPPNATCATAEALALPSMSVVGTTVGATDQRSTTSCATTTSGGQLVYYTANVPAGRSVHVRVTPSSMSFNPSIRAFVGCMPTTCAEFINAAPAGAAENLVYRNTSMTDETVVFAVGSTTDRDQGSFTIDATLLPASATNNTCAMARPLTAGTTLLQQQVTATEASSATCLAGSTGRVLYYSVTVPPMTRATVRATPYSTRSNAVLRVRQDCGTMACVASADNTFSGSVETVTWTNTGATPVNYIVELGSTSATTAGTFDVELVLTDASPAYTLVALPSASCEDLSMGSTSLMITGDDVASAVTPLPMGFNFPFFGDAMNVVTHFSANTNGLAQLFTSATGPASTSFSNALLPSDSAPPGALAVFWDDQEIDLMERMGAVVRYAVVGTAPNRRLVIEWNDIKFLSSTTETMRYQVKLSEGSGIIEYHYCSMSSTSMTATRHTGTDATIGLQNISRTRGQIYLHNGTDTGMMGGMPMSVGGGTMSSPSLLRFIPR